MGIQAILLYSEMALFYKLSGLTLEEQYDKIQETFGFHNDFTYSIQFVGSKGQQDMIDLINNVRSNPIADLCGVKVVKYNDYLYGKSYTLGETKDIKLDPSNLLKFFLEDGSSIAIRPSGTEPKCKIYVEAVSTSNEEANSYREKLYEDFKQRYNINY